MVRLAPLTAVVLLLVLAGCSLPTGGQTTDSVTPVSVTVPENETPTTVDPATEAGPYASWIDAHRAALNGSAYAYNVTQRTDREGENTSISRTYLVVGPNRSEVFARYTGGDIEGAFWRNQTYDVRYFLMGDSRQYDVRRLSDPNAQGFQSVLASRLEHLRVQNITETDTGYRVTGVLSEQGRIEVVSEEEAVENTSVSLSVRESGLIETFRTSVAVDPLRGPAYRQVVTFAIDESVERVPRPEWVNRTLRNATGGTYQTPL
jgi:hypothetical protein